ncbi:hypothetical protein A2U01_0000608 [Trifolium medium]|uniref:Uncharacterized protein n=1 Tax=Trifolium medium TaxID=97028 RepID=A0A392LY29_9FABA|nr:hypothetical protein [Trifolium medium]
MDDYRSQVWHEVVVEKSQIHNKDEKTRNGKVRVSCQGNGSNETANARDMSDGTDNHCDADEETVDLVVKVYE